MNTIPKLVTVLNKLTSAQRRDMLNHLALLGWAQIYYDRQVLIGNGLVAGDASAVDFNTLRDDLQSTHRWVAAQCDIMLPGERGAADAS